MIPMRSVPVPQSARTANATAIWRLVLILACLGSSAASAERLMIGSFAAGDVSGWEEKSFKGKTSYQLTFDPQLGKSVLGAATQGAASGRIKKIQVDLRKTPYLNWSWKIEQPYAGLDESTKGGDDFPVRVYVVAQRGVFGLATRALNYVWASSKPVGQSWPNPFTANARMIAQDSGSAGAGQWMVHKRNVRADWQAAFGDAIEQIDAVAIMTDGDNSGLAAGAWYGDIFFSDH
ncbi:MAG TPA: DUF3047 domain-containing protein [Burkholderiaceae bacterium]|nr:DUF3047 domain-containing protein [Burkholderiaceae bacterium]